MRRHILGLIALAALASSATIYWYPPLEQYRPAGAMGLRIGSVLGVLWLAWPDLYRLPRWVWYVLPLGILALIYAKGLLIYLIPTFAVAATLYFLYRKIRRSSR